MKRLLAPVLLAAGLIAPAHANAAFYGFWRTPVDGGGVVRLEACGQSVCGYIVKSPRLTANPDQRDVRNKDKVLRARPLKDLKIVEVRQLSAQRLGGGWVYNPEDGNTYSGSITLMADGALRLEGCIVWPLCQSQIWRRAN